MSQQLPPFDLNYYMSDDYQPKKNESMYIEASAGTGKTYTITGIIQTLVGKRKIKLDEILVVTYTEKAVGELRDRIRKAVTKLSLKDADVDNAPIFTIHSFCQTTLSEYAFTARQPQNLSLADKSELDDFIDYYIRDKLIYNEDFKELFDTMDIQESNIESLKKDLSDAISKYYLNEEGNPVAEIVSLDNAYLETEAKKTRPARLYTYDEAEKLQKTAQTDYDSIKDEYISVFTGITSQKNPDNVRTFKQANFCHKILKEIYLAWQKEKEENKLQTYDDMLRNVRESVCEADSPLLARLRKKYKYAIIDEFQDTNQKQWDTFSKIFLEDPEHTIIVVGDPKQSIYSFQGADVNVYKNAIQEITDKGGSAYSLLTNYRSSDEMVEACNIIFNQRTEEDIRQNDKKSFFDADAGITFTPSAACHGITAASFDDEKTPPLWIAGSAEERVSEKDFARIAVQKIIECCSITNGKTRLQLHDETKEKDCHALRNAGFHDFAILARTTSEMEEIEREMQKAGLPFLRYKDKNLFAGSECIHWISLLNAISAADFTGRNRAILSEALFTDFFGIPLEEVNNEKYDNPYCEERQKIIVWQELVKNRKWAKLLERIFADTDIENRLSGLENLQALSKFRQIGTYAVEYLYKNNNSIEELSKHLTRLSYTAEGIEEGDNLVAKGTDFDCVQLMTIHASKGLGFPVVICPGGFKKLNEQIAHSYLYHENGQAKLGFGSYAKKQMRLEENFERQRLFYVAYTRATSLMILPYYEKWIPNKALYQFLDNSFENIFAHPDKEKYCKEIRDNGKKPDELKALVQEILAQLDTGRKTETAQEAEKNAEGQLKNTQTLSKEVPSLILRKHSYSSLSHGANKELLSENGGRTDKDESVQGAENFSLAGFDPAENPVTAVYNKAALPLTPPQDFPRGTKLGIALHEVFEKADFQTDENNEELHRLISTCFEKQTFSMDSLARDSWKQYMAGLAWNTLNDTLPEITGGSATGKTFTLSELTFENRIAEAEFNLNPADADGKADSKSDTCSISRLLKNYCNGFIDLVFKRGDLYSILDWKSDTFEPLQYSDADFLKEHTDQLYSIQRVLYSYSLIKWLRSFYKEETEDEIFEKHFGGIYYAYVRGCRSGSANGIYARTWKDWSELETAFRKICSTLITAK